MSQLVQLRHPARLIGVILLNFRDSNLRDTRMRLLVLYQAKNPEIDQPGYFEGFQRMVGEGRLSTHSGIGYFGVARERGWNALWDETYDTAKKMEADAIFLHFFHAEMPDPTQGILKIKSLPNRPIVFTSLGDGFGRWTHRIPKSFRVASSLSDVSFLTGLGYQARQLAAWGSANLVLMPNGCCQVRFSSCHENANNEPEFHVAFIGSRIKSRNPAGHFFWTARKRVAFVDAMTRRFGKRFGLFGKGWEGYASWQGQIPYSQQHDAYRRSEIALGGTPNASHDFYTSDRVFIAAASGVPLVDFWVPGVERILMPGRDWWLGRDSDEMLGLAERLLEKPREERVALGREARRQVLEHHTQYNRCVEMIAIVQDLRSARLKHVRAPEPKLEFLLKTIPGHPSLDAVLNWRG